jgi:diguanylate cyclase (GGDEF)-like protein
MRKCFTFDQLKIAILISCAYYALALLGVYQTVSAQGIAIVWLANAVILAALLILPYRQWPLILIGTLVAEVIADISTFPIWSAVSFGLINILEVTLAATLIRRISGEHFDFDKLRRGGYFLLFGPLIACAIAGLIGATINLKLGNSALDYSKFWLIWWFGDALGLILLTPMIVVVWRFFEYGIPKIPNKIIIEATLFSLILVLIGIYAFSGNHEQLQFLVSPLLLLSLGVYAAIRFGVLGATFAVTIVATLAVYQLTQGIYPYSTKSVQEAVWLTQEYLALISVVSVGLAILMREINNQRRALEEKEYALRMHNSTLESHVHERTLLLEKANNALHEANIQLAHIASVDELTGIANRQHFRTEAQRELNRLKQDNQTASMILIDLDYFKRVNDTYGHGAGDFVLKSIAEPIRQSLRPKDLLGRMGGEEFFILLTETNVNSAANIAERIRQALESLELHYDGNMIKITASLGVAELNKHENWSNLEDLDDLTSRADQALYRAKEHGRNRVETATE